MNFLVALFLHLITVLFSGRLYALISAVGHTKTRLTDRGGIVCEIFVDRWDLITLGDGTRTFPCRIGFGTYFDPKLLGTCQAMTGFVGTR